MFEFLGVFQIPDADANFAALSLADVVDDPPMNKSSFEVTISIALVIQCS